MEEETQLFDTHSDDISVVRIVAMSDYVSG